MSFKIKLPLFFRERDTPELQTVQKDFLTVADVSYSRPHVEAKTEAQPDADSVSQVCGKF